MIPLKDADDFYEVYDAFIEWVVDRYWTEEEKRVCKPLLRDAVVGYMERKFGKGKSFEIEKVCILGTAKKPARSEGQVNVEGVNGDDDKAHDSGKEF